MERAVQQSVFLKINTAHRASGSRNWKARPEFEVQPRAAVARIEDRVQAGARGKRVHHPGIELVVGDLPAGCRPTAQTNNQPGNYLQQFSFHDSFTTGTLNFCEVGWGRKREWRRKKCCCTQTRNPHSTPLRGSRCSRGRTCVVAGKDGAVHPVRLFAQAIYHLGAVTCEGPIAARGFGSQLVCVEMVTGVPHPG